MHGMQFLDRFAEMLVLMVEYHSVYNQQSVIHVSPTFRDEGKVLVVMMHTGSGGHSGPVGDSSYGGHPGYSAFLAHEY